MDAIKVEFVVPGTGDPLTVRAQLYQKVPGVGWVMAGSLITTDVDDFSTDVASALTASFAGNDPA